MTTFGYIRISSQNQADNYNIPDQQDQLSEYVQDERLLFVDVASAVNSDRPELQRLLKQVEPGDKIYVTKLDRFARNLRDAAESISDLEKRNVELISLDMPMATEPHFLHHILLAFAELETAQRKERQMIGIRRAQAENKYKGRKSVITPKLLESIKKLHWEKGNTKQDVAKLLNISRSTLYRCLRQIEKEKADG